MRVSHGVRIAAAAGAGALAISLIGVAPSQAGPGDWTNISAISAGQGYPEISTSAVAALKVFGDEVQVAWSQADGTNTGGIYVAALNKNGDVVRGASPAVTGGRMNRIPQLVTYQGQRALSFGGNLGQRTSRGQNLATSPDGVTWTLNPGSLSATNLADVCSGGGTVEAQSPAPNTLIWACAPNLGSVTWHIGLAPTNPAQTPDGRYDPPPGQQTSGVNVVYEASTQKTFVGFYNSSTGTFFGEIAPNYNGFNLISGSAGRGVGQPGDIVPMAARAQGGVYVAYLDPAEEISYRRGVIVQEMNSGRTWKLPNSAGASAVAMGAAPNGRIWVTYEVRGEMYVVQTDPGATDFGAARSWGSPQKGSTIYGSAITGDDASAYIGVNAQVGGDQNIAVVAVLPNLTVDVVGRAQAGKSVTLRVRDGGAPVRNARVKIGNKTLKTGKGGVVKFTAPRAKSVKVTATGPGYASSSRTVGLR